MANYTFLDASGNSQTAGSSVIGSVNYPVVKILDPVSVMGTLSQTGTRISSISGTVVVESVVGTYAEDAQHTTGEKGLFVLGVRNDTLSSITSLDTDYSPMVVGPMGEGITANAPITKWIYGVASTVNSSVTTLIPAQGASIFSYITSYQVVNTGAVPTLVTFKSGSVVLGYASAPTSVMGFPTYLPNALKSLSNASIDIQATAASSIISVSAQGFIAKT